MHSLMDHHPLRRQVQPALTSAKGIAGATIINTALAPAGTSLLLDTAGGGVPLAAPTFIQPTDPTLPSSTQSEQPTSTQQGASSNAISVGTVVGTCIGAFAGVALLLFLAFLAYRRHSRSLKSRSQRRQPGPSDLRNARSNSERTRSGFENWNKLEEGSDDKWEDQYQTKEVDNGAMEKLTMFKKSTPSVRTAYTTAETNYEPMPFNFGSHPFAQYHPPTQEVPSQTQVPLSPDIPSPRPFLGRVDTGPSWDGDSMGDSSFLTLRSDRLSTGAMSPTPAIAIPTPRATPSDQHRWESAEVHYTEAQSAEILESYQQGIEERERQARAHSNNPFFTPPEQVRSPTIRQLPSPPIQPSSPLPSSPPFRSRKGKERAYDPPEPEVVDPFTDEHMPTHGHYDQYAMSSSASGANSDRAIQSLIAALDVSQEGDQAGLRVASLQPSVFSTTSMYTNGEEEDVTTSFPLPPSTASSQRGDR